jgi:hypothetical protein
MKASSKSDFPSAPSRRPTRLPARLYKKLVRRVSAFADSLRNDLAFSIVISASLRGFRADLLRATKGQFPLRRGRPTDPLIDAACDRVREGNSVPEVLRSQIPNWRKLDPYTRYLAAKGLRQAVARRKKRMNGSGAYK